MNKKGIVLILSFLVVTVLTVLLASLFFKTINENNLTQRHLNSVQAFWLAEAGIAEAVKNLPGSTPDGCLSTGYCYSVDISALPNSYYQIDSTGSVSLPSGEVINQRALRAVARTIPPDISSFPHAIEITGSLITKGNAYTINGTVSENAAVNFSDLFEHSKAEIEAAAAYTYQDTLIEPVGMVTWVNVSTGTELTVAGDLEGSGVLIVAGDVHFSGTVDFDGILYVMGRCRMSGTPTINGAVFVESEADIDATISGHVTMNYDVVEITEALTYLGLTSSEIRSWQELAP